MIHIEEVKAEQQQVLFNYMQKYLYEMSLYYGGEMNLDGNFEYPYLPFYFGEKTRTAYFICEDNSTIGFALINAHSFTGEPVNNCIAEFTVFPSYRHSGNAMRALELLMQERPGSWQLKYSTENKIGAAFWEKVSDKYNGSKTPLEGNEIALTIR